MRRLFVLLFLMGGCFQTSTWNGLQCESSQAIDPMKRQPRYDPYEPSEFFADGRSMRIPPPGTVPRDFVQLSLVNATGLEGGGYVQRAPRPPTDQTMQEGRQRFHVTCEPCHGILGDGVSEVASKMSLRPPPSLVDAPVRDYPPGRVFQVITEGYGLMPPYRAELSVDERWAVVDYVRALRLSHRAPLALVPPSDRQRLKTEPNP